MKIYNPVEGKYPVIAVRVGRFAVGVGYDGRCNAGNSKMFKLRWNVFSNNSCTLWIFYRFAIGFRIWDKK